MFTAERFPPCQLARRRDWRRVLGKQGNQQGGRYGPPAGDTLKPAEDGAVNVREAADTGWATGSSWANADLEIVQAARTRRRARRPVAPALSPTVVGGGV